MSTSRGPKSDRRVSRTHRLLRDALVALLHERGWDEISVQDVCERADVGRSTFYNHFADKEELLVGGFDELRRSIRAGQPSSPPAPGPLRFARALIEHAHDHRRLFQALVGKRSGQVVLRRFRDLVVSLVVEDLAPDRRPGPEAEALVHFVAGGFLELLTWWLDHRTALLPADVERLFLRMATPALEAVAPGGR